MIKWQVHLFIVLLFLYGSAFAQMLQPLKGQYIRIELPGAERTLSLAEVNVYSGRKNIALNGKPTQVSTFTDAVAARAIDGNSAGQFFGRSVTSTATQANPWWELDLGSEEVITRIIIHNRTDCCGDRINPARILVLSKLKEVVWEGVINTTESQYEFSLAQSSKAGLSVSQNLLRNSNFQQRTNHSIPDYWDLHHVAALTMRNLHDQYGIDDKTQSPVPGTRVLKIQNSEVDFSYLNLMPRRFFSDLPDGEYTFSVYLKSGRSGMEYKVTRAWAKGEPVTQKLTTTWERYSATFRISQKNSDSLQPIMFFPSNGTYYVAAPQLERGKNPTPFRASIEDAVSETSLVSLKQQLKTLVESLSSMASQHTQPFLSAAFEYDYYTSHRTARLILTSRSNSEIIMQIKCVSDAGKLISIPIKREVAIRPFSSTEIDVSIRDLPLGIYTCFIEPISGDTRQPVVTAKLTKLLPGQVEVRINRLRRFITIDDKPFQLIGIGVGGWRIPPDWYFEDIAARGINTVFYTRPPNSSGEHNINDVKAFVSGAARHGLKAIIGIPLAGAKAANWRQRVLSFSKLISSFKEDPSIIGWYPVDEPAAHTWQDNELIEIYDAVKKADPYRVIFVNWAYDGVPSVIGQEPRGTLNATDIYSIDYYPFAGQRHSMEGFASTSVRALSTASSFKKISHSWIQIYGGMDAWREPTGDEISYMVYLNLIYGGLISYWDTKSNSNTTWQRVSEINHEVKMLAETIVLHPGAREVLAPTMNGSFFYAAWGKGKRIYLIVVHGGSAKEDFTFSPKAVLGMSDMRVWSQFEERSVPLQDGTLRDAFAAFQRKVYVLDSD